MRSKNISKAKERDRRNSEAGHAGLGLIMNQFETRYLFGLLCNFISIVYAWYIKLCIR